MDRSYQIPAGFLNRSMLREQANVTEHELKTLEGQGLIKATRRNSYGWRLYSTGDVERVRRLADDLRRGKRSARTNNEEPPRLSPAYQEPVLAYSLDQYRAVYTQFEKGTAIDKIPMVVDIHPSVLSVILKDAKHLAGAFIVAKPIVDAINKIPFRDIGSIRSADELLQALEKLSETADKELGCVAEPNGEPCKNSAKICVACAALRYKPRKPNPVKPDASASSNGSPDVAAPPLSKRTRERRRRERQAPPPDTSGSAPT